MTLFALPITKARRPIVVAQAVKHVAFAKQLRPHLHCSSYTTSVDATRSSGSPNDLPPSMLGRGSSSPRLESSKPSQDPSQASSTGETQARESFDSPPNDTSSFESTTSPLPPSWEEEDFTDLESFTQLPNKDFGANQLIETNEEFKRSLRQILRGLPSITHAFAYGSGVFPQSDEKKDALSPHPNPPEAIKKWQKGGGKMIDFILATRFSQHFHSLNLRRHRNHYSFLGSLGSAAVSRIQDSFGAGAYFNPYVTINGTLIKYGVVNMTTLYRDLSEWDTLYLAGRLHKPVKILTEDPNIR